MTNDNKPPGDSEHSSRKFERNDDWLNQDGRDALPEYTVDDDEGYVDRQVKDHILNLRRQIDDDERRLYAERRADPNDSISVAEANHFWGLSIRQYLRGIKRLWGDDDTDVKGVEEYWDTVRLGRVTLTPPDKDGYPFSQLAQAQGTGSVDMKRHIGVPLTAELPEPKTTEFYGLRSVLEENRIRERWEVTVAADGPALTNETMLLSREIPVPKHILENAVEAADNFLQQAGLGFSTGAATLGKT
jgi:hypothetical protein